MGYHETHVNSTLGVSFFPIFIRFFLSVLGCAATFFFTIQTPTQREKSHPTFLLKSLEIVQLILHDIIITLESDQELFSELGPPLRFPSVSFFGHRVFYMSPRILHSLANLVINIELGYPFLYVIFNCFATTNCRPA